MKLTTKQAVSALNNPSVVFEGGKVQIIPCFRSLSIGKPFLAHLGEYFAEKTKKMVTVHFWYNDQRGWPKKCLYAKPPKRSTPAHVSCK